MVNQTVIRAFQSRYTLEQLQAALDQSLADLASGVQVTNVTFEGGGASGRPISGDPTFLVEHLQVAIEQLQDPNQVNRPMSTAIDLSHRPFGT